MPGIYINTFIFEFSHYATDNRQSKLQVLSDNADNTLNHWK